MDPSERPEQGSSGEVTCGVHLQQHVSRMLSQLWRSQQLCDVKLQPCDSDVVLPAHRIVLASSSGFFRAVFCGAGQVMKEGTVADNSNVVVQLPYSRQQITDLLTMLYDYSIRVCSSNVAWMLDMASYLEIHPLQEACCSFLQDALRRETCIDVVLIAHHYQCGRLQTEAVQYIARHLASLLLQPELRQGLCRLPSCLLQDVLASEALEVELEAELLCFISDWISANPQERLYQLPQFLTLLQLPALPQEAPLSHHQLDACTSPAAAQLALQLRGAAVQRQQQQGSMPTCSVDGIRGIHSVGNQTSTVPSIDPNNWASSSSSSSSSSLSSRSLIDAAVACGVGHNSSTPASALSSSSSHGSVSSTWLDEWLSSSEGLRGIGAVVAEAWPGTPRGYQATKLLVAGGHDLSWRGLKATEMYDPRTDSWTSGPTLPAALPFAGAGLLSRGQLYIVGGGMYSSLMARLDVDDGCWHTLEGPKTPRLHAAVTGSSGLLYVTGGRSQVNQVVPAVEIYDPSIASWKALPDMQQARYAHALVPLAGCVYAVGGQASKLLHRTVELFHAERGTWELLPHQLLTERKYCAAAALAGRLVVLGGMNESRSRLNAMEAFDPREGRWTGLTDMLHARSSCGVAVLGGRLYAVGGNAGDKQLHAAVEVYDAAAGKWRSCAALSCGRSGLLAAAV